MNEAPKLTDWIVAIFTIVIAGVGYLQWKSIDGQLSEMKASGKQTDQLLSLYSQQVQAQRDLVTKTQESIELAKATFAKEQRPYIWLGEGTKETLNIKMEIAQVAQGKQIVVTVQFQNFGKAAAIFMRHYHGIQIGEDAALKISHRPWVNGKRIMPSGKTDTFSTVSDLLTDQQVSHILATSGAVAIFATWQYTDFSGKKYESQICLGRLNLGGWAYCENHNDIKDCSEDKCEQ